MQMRPNKYYKEITLRQGGSDLKVFEQVFRFLQYGIVESFKPINTIIDAGANIGLSSIFFSEILGSPKIIGIEPEKNNFQQALLNTKDYPNVRIINAALWPTNKKLFISNQSDAASWAFTVNENNKNDENCVRTNAISISEILKTTAWEKVDLLKIDIEGAEKILFSDISTEEWLPRVGIIIIELHDWIVPGAALAFFRAISKLQNIEFMLSGENIVIINKLVNR
jgi:FkbM family methyltransferase